ncbi:MAG: PEP-CTERM sorting domain-containing protein [Candidatus Pacebacteria bacterium]|nr:PEP-CTERM sorting domain-containing protein [Candidatus Paceibacterota bacterium]
MRLNKTMMPVLAVTMVLAGSLYGYKINPVASIEFGTSTDMNYFTDKVADPAGGFLNWASTYGGSVYLDDANSPADNGYAVYNVSAFDTTDQNVFGTTVSTKFHRWAGPVRLGGVSLFGDATTLKAYAVAINNATDLSVYLIDGNETTGSGISATLLTNVALDGTTGGVIDFDGLILEDGGVQLTASYTLGSGTRTSVSVTRTPAEVLGDGVDLNGQVGFVRLSTYNGRGQFDDFSAGQLVPEPSILALLTLGGTLVLFRRQRR